MGTRKDEKGKRLEFLISRIDESLEKGFYVEAMAITYALFEERTYRFLDRLSIAYNSDKLCACLKKLEKAIDDRTVSISTKRIELDGFIDLLDDELIKSSLISEIQAWRDKRNTTMHDMAKMTIAYSSLKSVCEEGRNLFAKYSTIIMRVKSIIDS